MIVHSTCDCPLDRYLFELAGFNLLVDDGLRSSLVHLVRLSHWPWCVYLDLDVHCYLVLPTLLRACKL